MTRVEWTKDSFPAAFENACINAATDLFTPSAELVNRELLSSRLVGLEDERTQSEVCAELIRSLWPEFCENFTAIITDKLVNGPGFCLVENLPFYELEDSCMLPWMLGVCAVLGELSCVGGLDRIVWPVKPKLHELSQDLVSQHDNVSETFGRAELHTDNSFHITPDQAFSLWCINPANDGGETVLVDARSAIKSLFQQDGGIETVKYLRDNPLPFSAGADRIIIAPVIGVKTQPFFRYRRSMIAKGLYESKQPDTECVEILNTLDLHLSDSAFQGTFTLRRGHVLFVNNHELLHGRLPFNDESRFLFRIRIQRLNMPTG